MSHEGRHEAPERSAAPASAEVAPPSAEVASRPRPEPPPAPGLEHMSRRHWLYAAGGLAALVAAAGLAGYEAWFLRKARGLR